MTDAAAPFGIRRAGDLRLPIGRRIVAGANDTANDMVDGPAILILTQCHDPATELVTAHLRRRRASVFRCDLADFPQRWRLGARLNHTWTGGLRIGNRTLDLADVRCAYYRKPTRFDFPAGLPAEELCWAEREARLAIQGIVTTLPRWLNHPVAVGRANYKPLQLVEAQAAGFGVPDTLVTNDPDEAAAFADEVGETVYKPLFPTFVDRTGHGRFIYATPVGRDELPDASIACTAHMFQRRIPRQYEIRLTVVDRTMFATRLDGHCGTDWRSDRDLRYSVVDVPDQVAAAACKLMQKLALRFAALDLIVTPDDDYVFLECNPNGEWAWIEKNTGLPIAEAIANALLEPE